MNNQVRKRRQQMKSCDTCRRRKVRCDADERTPCSACEKSRIECRSTADWKTSRSRRHASSNVSSSSRAERPSSSDQSTVVAGPTAPTQTLIPEDFEIAEGLARSGLSRFFQIGVDSTEWLVFDSYERVRQAYIGNQASNLAHLVTLKQPTSSMSALHYPYPPIRPALPWKPENGIWGLKGNVDIAQDLSCFPAKDVRDDLVDSFFTKVHPGFPVIDELAFRTAYADPENPPPLLLLQSVLLAGAHVCDHPKVANARSVVKAILFRRASMLFHIRHENNRTNLIQAAMLFTWHLENADTVSANSYYWMGIASRMCFGMGYHRNVYLDGPKCMPLMDSRLSKRIWWTAFQAETYSALEHGRPSMISLDDFDQLPLEKDDFKEGSEAKLNENIQFEYCERNIKLCHIVIDILVLNSPAAKRNGLQLDMTTVNSRLGLWAIDLPIGNDFWALQLRMNYNMVLLHLYRNFSDPSSNPNSATESLEICREASEAIVSIFETMMSEGTLCQCYFTSVMALTAAAIQISKDVKGSITKGSTLVAFNIQSRLSRLLQCAKALSVYWSNAEAVYRIFLALHEQFESLIMRSLQDRSNAVGGGVSPVSEVNWQDFLGTLYSTHVDALDEQEWMNIAH